MTTAFSFLSFLSYFFLLPINFLCFWGFTEKFWPFVVINNQLKYWYSITFMFFGYHLFLFVVGSQESPVLLLNKFCSFWYTSCFGKLRLSADWSLKSWGFLMKTMLIFSPQILKSRYKSRYKQSDFISRNSTRKVNGRS